MPPKGSISTPVHVIPACCVRTTASVCGCGCVWVCGCGCGCGCVGGGCRCVRACVRVCACVCARMRVHVRVRVRVCVCGCGCVGMSVGIPPLPAHEGQSRGCLCTPQTLPCPRSGKQLQLSHAVPVRVAPLGRAAKTTASQSSNRAPFPPLARAVDPITHVPPTRWPRHWRRDVVGTHTPPLQSGG